MVVRELAIHSLCSGHYFMLTLSCNVINRFKCFENNFNLINYEILVNEHISESINLRESLNANYTGVNIIIGHSIVVITPGLFMV